VNKDVCVFVQAINILIVNQSIIDMCVSFITLLTRVIDVDGTRIMSSSSVSDQLVCRVWLARVPLWSLLVMSTYGILITAFERYFAVIYPMWYSVSVSLYDSTLINIVCSISSGSALYPELLLTLRATG